MVKILTIDPVPVSLFDLFEEGLYGEAGPWHLPNFRKRLNSRLDSLGLEGDKLEFTFLEVPESVCLCGCVNNTNLGGHHVPFKKQDLAFFALAEIMKSTEFHDGKKNVVFYDSLGFQPHNMVCWMEEGLWYCDADMISTLCSGDRIFYQAKCTN